MTLILALLLLLLPSLALSQPTFSAVTGFVGTSATSCGGSVDATGTNTILVGSITLVLGAGFPTTSGITYNSLAFTSVVSQAEGTDGNVSQWVRHAPTTGANTFTATFSELVAEFDCQAILLQNAHQSAAVGSSEAATGFSSNAGDTVVSTTDELVIGSVYGAQAGWTGCTAGTDETERYDNIGDTENLACGVTQVGIASTVIDVTLGNGPGGWAFVMAAYKEVAAAGVVAGPFRRRLW